MARLQVRELTPEFGAEIEGLDAHGRIDDDQRALLRKVFDDRGLLVFHDLDLDARGQGEIAAALIGERGPVSAEAAEEGAQGTTQDTAEREYFVSNKEPGGNAPYGRLLFHSDMMWSDTPFQVLSLYGLDVEQPAVPTAFVSAAAAWDRLPDDLRARVDGLHALHVTGQQARGGGDEELLQPIRENAQMSTTSVGHHHPRTGRTLLYVCQMMTREIVELPAKESEALLEELFAHLYDEAHVLRHGWRNGDLVAWDNLAIQHARSDVRSNGPTRTLRKAIAPKSVVQRLETPRFTKVG